VVFNVNGVVGNFVDQSLCMSVFPINYGEGQPIVSAACSSGNGTQAWALYSDGTIRQVSGGATSCLSAGGTAAGNLSYFVPCDGSLSQRWSTTAAGTGTAPTELFSQQSSHLCLDIADYKTTTHNIDLTTCTGSSSQLWTLP
jgi:hypothetical protein